MNPIKVPIDCSEIDEDMQKRAADHAMKTVLPYILLIVALLAGTLIAIVLAWLLF